MTQSLWKNNIATVLKTLKVGVTNTFNTGAGSKLDFLDAVGVTPGINAINATEIEDESRIKSANFKVAASSRLSRRKRRGDKRKKEEIKKTIYFSGDFSPTKEPEFNIDGEGSQNSKRRVIRSRKSTKPKEAGTNKSAAVPKTPVPETWDLWRSSN